MIKLSRKSLIILLVLVALISTFALFSCNREDLIPPDTTISVSTVTCVEKTLEGLDTILNQASVVNKYNIDLNAEFNIDNYDYQVKLKANVNPAVSESATDDSELLLEVKRNNSLYIGVYYLNEILYLQLPPIGEGAVKKIKITDIYLSDILNMNMSISDDIDLLKGIISAFITKSSYLEEEDVETITFEMNIRPALDGLLDIIAGQYSGININETLGIFGYSRESISQFISIDNCVVKVVLNNDILDTVEVLDGEESLMKINALSISSNFADFVVPVNDTDYTLYSPTNLDFSGELKISFDDGVFGNQLGEIELETDLETDEYIFDYRIRVASNFLKPVDDRALIELTISEGKTITAYYSGQSKRIYIDLSAIDGPKTMITNTELDDIMSVLLSNVSEGTATLSRDIEGITAILVALLSDISLEEGIVSIDLDNDALNNLLAEFGLESVLEVDSIGANINISNYNIETFEAWVFIGGIKLDVTSNSFSMGSAPTIPIPANLSSYTTYSSIETTFLDVEGKLQFSTVAEDTTAYLENTISELIDEPYELSYKTNDSNSPVIVEYSASIGIDMSNGLLDNSTIMIYEKDTDILIVGLKYIQNTSTLYIIQGVESGQGTVLSVDEYVIDYNASALQSIFNGTTSSSNAEIDKKVILSNDSSTNKVVLNINNTAYYKAKQVINDILFNGGASGSFEYNFTRILVNIFEDRITGSLEYRGNSGNSDAFINISVENLSFGYDPVNIVGIEEDTTLTVNNSFANNSLYEVVHLVDEEGNTYACKVDEWSYDTSNYNEGTYSGTAVASTTVMGYEVSVLITFNGGGYSYSDVLQGVPLSYDINDRFADPIGSILSHNTITLTIDSQAVEKDIIWDLDEIIGQNSAGDYIIELNVMNFLNQVVNVDSYTIHLEGDDVTGVAFNIEFDAYGKVDPRLTSSYPAEAIMMNDGVVTNNPTAVGERVRVEWDLTNLLNQYENGTYNAFASEFSTTVDANIITCFGYDRKYPVTITIHPATIETISFEGVVLGNGMPLDEGRELIDSSSQGVYWDDDEEDPKFVINPLRITKLTENHLPSTVTVTTVSGDELVFNGIKWDISSSVNIVAGASDYTIQMMVGDAIGGYQTYSFKVIVENLVVTSYKLFYDDVELTTSIVESLVLKYTLNNPYNYRLPNKVKLNTSGAGRIYDLNLQFVYENLDIETLYNGTGDYESGEYITGTYQLGGQLLTIHLVCAEYLAVNENGLSFDNIAEEDKIEGESYLFYHSAKGLVFNPYTGLDFTDVSIYPPIGKAQFIGVAETIEIPLKWNISAITSLYASSNPNLYTSRSIKISATTDFEGCGEQIFYTYVYIEPAIIESVVYEGEDVIDGNHTSIYSIDMFGVILDEGADPGPEDDTYSLEFIDPTNYEFYPTTVFASYSNCSTSSRVLTMDPEYVNVSNWNLSEIENAYAAADFVTDIAGTYNIIATVGTLRGGYQNVTLQVNITTETMSDILFTNIPLLGSGKQAFIYDSTVELGYYGSLTFNPYAANVKDSSSYPSEMNFTITFGEEIIDFTEQVEWDLSAIQNLVPYQGGERIVNAILPLSGSNLIAVPVKVIVETMIVKTINNEGLFNIFVDPLDDAPFGRRNTVSTNIKQTVQATFVNNSDVIELVLNYSRVGVKLDFNGNTYVDGTATIGNDFGDYQPITDGIISINIVQRQIEQVYANMYNSLGVLVQVSIFEATYVDVTDPVTGELLYQDITKTIGNDSEIDDIGVLYYDNSPSSIFVKFTGLSELIEIQPRKENSLGLCYEGLSGDDPVIKIINIIPAFLDAEGEDTVFINNPEENIDAVELEDVYGSLILTSTEPESTYSGSFVDNGLDVLDIIKSYFLDEEIQIGDGFINSTYVTEENEDVSLYYEFYYFQSDTEYETYHLVDDGFGNIRPINEDDDHIIPAYVEEVTEDYYMNAGVYVIRAYVRGNTQYGGYDEVLFRIYPRDYTNNIVMTLVNGEIDTSPEALDPDDPLGDIGTVNALISLEYRGTPYVVNARIGTGYASMTKFLPVYPDGEAPVDVGTYIITFILQTEDGIINDICTNSVTLTIEKTTLDEIPYRAGSEGVPEIIANDEEFVELELNESTDLSIVYAEENVANYVLNVYGVSIPFVYSIYTDYDCTNTIVGSIYAQNVGKYYLKIEEIDNNNYTLNAKFEIEVENASMNVEEDIDYSVDNVSGTQIPDHHLTIYGVIVTDFTNCPIEYYTAGGGVIVPNITTAIPGNYESRITINIPNYEPVTITATFVKS